MKKIYYPLLIFFSFCSVIIILLISEFCVRLFLGDKINLQYNSANLYEENVYGATAGWRAGATGVSCDKPVKINSYRLRGPEVNLNTENEKWLLIGDSVLFGMGVEDSLTIAGRLREVFPDATVLNSGVIGYDSFSYVDIFQYWSHETQIDKVFLFFNLTDVLQTNEVQKISFLKDIKCSIFAFLRAKSKLYIFIKNIVSDRSEVFFLSHSKNYKENNPLLKSALHNICIIYNKCKESNIDFKIVLLPYEYQLRENTDEVWAPQELLIKHLNEMGIPFLFINDLGNTDSRSLFLFADGIHFSAEGHKQIAQKLISSIKYQVPK